MTSNDNTYKKNMWCREVYWKVIKEQLGYSPFKETNGCHLRFCNRDTSNCRGAHDVSEIKPFYYITEYNNINKATYNWAELFSEILACLQKDSYKIQIDKHKQMLSDITSQNFFDVIRTWKILARFYRKLAKELKNENNLPCFYLSQSSEDVIWGLVRLTQFCPIHLKFKNAIQTNQKITIWDICLATGLNCKEGIHEINEKICEEDFLTGKCSCQTLKQLSVKQNELTMQIANLSNEISTNQNKLKYNTVEYQRHSNEQIKNNNTIYNLNKELKNLYNLRQIHYSDLGMIPFNTQYENYLEQKTKEQQKNEMWNHQHVENPDIIKTSIKVRKFGKV